MLVYECVLAVRDMIPQEAEAPITSVHASVHVSEYREKRRGECVEEKRSAAAQHDATWHADEASTTTLRRRAPDGHGMLMHGHGR